VSGLLAVAALAGLIGLAWYARGLKDRADAAAAINRKTAKVEHDRAELSAMDDTTLANRLDERLRARGGGATGDDSGG
jgi:uncharacterized protein (DUF2164 family)